MVLTMATSSPSTSSPLSRLGSLRLSILLERLSAIVEDGKSYYFSTPSPKILANTMRREAPLSRLGIWDAVDTGLSLSTLDERRRLDERRSAMAECRMEMKKQPRCRVSLYLCWFCNLWGSPWQTELMVTSEYERVPINPRMLCMVLMGLISCL